MRNGLIRAAMLLAATLIAACAATGPTAGHSSPGYAATPGPSAHGNAAPITLYVARRRWHIDVGFAVQALPAPLAATVLRAPHSQPIDVGRCATVASGTQAATRGCVNHRAADCRFGRRR